MNNILIKSPKQIKFIRKACNLAAECLRFAEKNIKIGITTKNLNYLIEDFIYSRGGLPACLNYNGFPFATCMSVNSCLCHGLPSNYKLQNGDMLKIDICVNLNGYIGDTCKTFCIGDISDIGYKLIEAGKKALEIGINQVKPGNQYNEIGFYIEEWIKNNTTFSICEDFCGHQSGVYLHEVGRPINHVFDPSNTDIMRKSEIFCIEPIIMEKSNKIKIGEDGFSIFSVDEGLSVQNESQILITKNSFEVLTI
jgi:methionyl aminopeptidase